MIPEDDFLLSRAERKRQREKRRRWIIRGSSLLLLIVIVLLLARPASHAIKGWQARRHAHHAFELIAQEKWGDAQKEALAGYQLSHSEPDAIRAVARFLSRTRQGQALEFWQELAKQQPLTREDLRDRVAVSLAFNESALAEAAAKELLGKREGGPQAADWLLAAQVAAHKGSGDQAAVDLQKIVADPKASERQQLQASLLLLATATADTPAAKQTQMESWERVTKIARGHSAAALDALTVLAQRAISSPSDLSTLNPPQADQLSTAQIAEAFEAHPLAKAPQKLIAVDLRIHSSPNEKEKLIQAAIDRWKGADAESLRALGTWLNGKGEFERELDTIPLDRALQTRDLFLQRLDALGALGRWQEIKQALNSESFPLDSVVATMYLARCNQQLGEIAAAANNWQRALEAAAGAPEKLIQLADYAEKNRATKIAAAAYDSAIEGAPKVRAAWQGKLRLAHASHDTQAINTVLAGMLKIWPNDAAIQNDEAYTRLLLLPDGNERSEESGRKSEGGNQSASGGSNIGGSPPTSDLAQIEALARDLVQREPTSLPHRTLLALAYLKQHRPATASGVYENIHIPPNALTPSALAVRAAVLQANGNLDDAAKEAAQVPRSALLPEEVTLLGGL